MIDLPTELRRLWALPSLREHRRIYRRPGRLPTLRTRRSKRGTNTLGWACWERHVIHLTLQPERDAIGLWTTLLHEIVHLCVGRSEHHGDRFWSAFIEAVEEAKGVIVPAPSLFALRYKWERDSLIEAAVRESAPVLQVTQAL